MGGSFLPIDGLTGLRGDGRGYALIAITGGSFLTIGVQMIYPVLLPELRESYGLDLTMAGVQLSVLWIVNAFGQLPGGVLADKLGEKTTLLASSLLTAVMLGFLIIGDSLIALFVATAALGLGIGLFGVARYTAIQGLYPEQAGTSIGIVLAGADAGQVLLPPIADTLVAVLTWQFGFGFTIPLIGILCVSIWL